MRVEVKDLRQKKERRMVQGSAPPLVTEAASLIEEETLVMKFRWACKKSELAMPVPDQVRDDGSGVHNLL